MCAIILPMRTERARLRAGLRTNFRSLGSDAFGAMMALGVAGFAENTEGHTNE